MPHDFCRVRHPMAALPRERVLLRVGEEELEDDVEREDDVNASIEEKVGELRRGDEADFVWGDLMTRGRREGWERCHGVREQSEQQEAGRGDSGKRGRLQWR